MCDPIKTLREEGIDFLLSNYSALDKYFKIKETGSIYINTDATLPTLARTFDAIEYPGIPFEDAVILCNNNRYAFRCVDDLWIPVPSPFTVQKLLYSSDRDIFIDPVDIYRDLRKPELVPLVDGFHPSTIMMEACKLISRYHYTISPDTSFPIPESFSAPIEMQRDLLSTVITGRFPEKGLQLLLEEGFIEKYWPELFSMLMVGHTKDYHPEGDVWEHTIQTFKYRKKPELILSLALLLHDIGKPVSQATPEKPFLDHAELGAKLASRFLRRLGFESWIVDEVVFLVRFHMLPAALSKLPLFRTEKLMESSAFPVLLELYRADLESSYKEPRGYYEACEVYRDFLRKKKNRYGGIQERKFGKRRMKR